MSDIHEKLLKVERYAADVGGSASGICRAATGNPRMYERLKRRAEYLDSVFAALDDYMAQNPVAPVGEKVAP
jgi:hypothetical protein